MKFNDFKDISNELYKTANILKLLNQHIYILEENKIYKMKIASITFEIIDNENVFFSLTCIPLVAFGLDTAYDECIVKYEDINKTWFYSYAAAKKSKIKPVGVQLSLF